MFLFDRPLPFWPRPVWARPVWAQACLGRGLFKPTPIWAQAFLGPGPISAEAIYLSGPIQKVHAYPHP